MPDIIIEIKKRILMGKTGMEKRRNFNSNGSMWVSPRKETLGTTLNKMERPSQEECTNIRPKGQMKCHSEG
jgi:hypothetical protein